MKYLLDSNTVSYLLDQHTEVRHELEQALLRGDEVLLCSPVLYELERGLRWRTAQKKLSVLRGRIVPKFHLEALVEQDWMVAAQYWADARVKGRQLSDIDLLLAALATRLSATIITNDNDFVILPVRTENWEKKP
ncbi:MAG: PIN domain-containing protein [Anaerolineae bacterium]|nr:PIN domain-containing protein [Anaerolineae bacterium]